MSESRQRWLVSFVSLSLTALLVGGVCGALVVWQKTHDQLDDPKFLRQQLEIVERSNGEPQLEKAPPPVRVGVAKIQPIRPETSIIGRLTEVRKVTVSSETTGKLLEMPVEIGTPVIGNETLLARVDATWSRLAVRRYESLVAVARAQLQYHQGELLRSEKLSERTAVTESEMELRRASVSEWMARLAEATASLDEEEERVLRAVVLAPFDGTVIEKHTEFGACVSPGDPLVDIVSRGQVDVRLMVPESLVNLMQVDQGLTLRVDALDEEVRGTVVSITPYGPTASRTFPVRLRLDDQGGRLKVGMSATALIPTGPERQALVVHKDGVLVRPDGSTVWVADSPDANLVAMAHPVPVKITARTEHEYAIELEVESDDRLLHDGALVVIEGAERLRPRLKVSLQDTGTSRAGVVERSRDASSGRVADPSTTSAPSAQEG